MTVLRLISGLLSHPRAGGDPSSRAANKWMPAFAGMTIILMLSACTAFNPPKPNLPARASLVPGEQVTVQGNQNVYSVAHKYNVSMRDLIVLNNIQPPYALRSGQKLTLPAGIASGEEQTAIGAPMPPPSASASGAVEQSTLPPIETASLPPVQAPPSKPAMPTAEQLSTPSPVRSVPTTAPSPQGQQIASITPPPPPPAPPPPEAPSMNLIWPVQGPVLSSFGSKGQGLSNDGVNIGAPKGAPVVASASGIVVYAGNEMKGFGNLVLIRHSGGWVTAYAHLDRVLVNKDAVVAQGDEIGTVGKSGGVGSPQLHFEVRYQSKPVDPAGVIKKD